MVSAISVWEIKGSKRTIAFKWGAAGRLRPLGV